MTLIKQPLWRVVLGAIVGCSIIIFLWTNSAYAPFKALPNGHYESHSDASGPSLAFYPWTTVTSFKQTSPETARTASIDDLCKLFPKDKLLEVQPILKTGHGVLPRVRNSLRTVSACLSNVLIFSNFQEEIDGHAVVDVIADIPTQLLESDSQTLPYRELLAAKANGSLHDGAMNATDGWQTDKFKFLPAISRAWRMAPEKRWYVFYEDDTFVFWDTVFRLLENYDADVPQYFGSPSPQGDGWFANGGPGHILSRGAMRRLVEGDWDKKTGAYLGSKLQEKYWEPVLKDCCGDSVLGRTLRAHGVLLKGLWPLFNPHPLHGIPFSDLYWCQPVLSLHKTLDDDLDKLWRWDFANTDTFRATTYRDLAVGYFNFSSLTTRPDWDNGDWDAYEPAADDPWTPHESAKSCSIACERATGCFQWTYHLRKCWFVRSIRLGRTKAPSDEKNHEGEEKWSETDKRFIAGWDTAKITRWIDDHPCHEVQWVTPSIERIF